MNFEKIKNQIIEIAEISQSIPEKFRDRCFEVLMNKLLEESEEKPLNPALPASTANPSISPLPSGSGNNTLPIKTQVRVFMKQSGVSEEQLSAILMFADGDIHFIKEPNSNGVAQGQLEWSLLLALKNAFLNDSLSVDPETVRSICQEKGYYDKKNFAAIFKRQVKYFVGLLEPQGASQRLSSEGITELGELVKKLANS